MSNNSNENCSFCEIKSNNLLIKGELVKVFHFLNNSLTPEHFVISPNRHVKNLFDLTRDELSELFNLSIKIERSLMKKNPNIEKFYTLSIGDSGNHFHFHFIPLYKDSPKLSPYIFGENGWAKNIRHGLNDIQEYKQLKNKLGEIQ
ncbi:HIT family protein [Niallia sp. HCP3S3_B10]|uniref:HIT family protein n=1 Tax=Niallia sp. HCP3S3_B10 TaxID=3438944 RepID=UPI003F8BF6C6